MDKLPGIDGAADVNTTPEQVTGYIDTLKARSVKVRYIEVPKATYEAGILGTKLLQDVVATYLIKK